MAMATGPRSAVASQASNQAFSPPSSLFHLPLLFLSLLGQRYATGWRLLALPTATWMPSHARYGLW